MSMICKSHKKPEKFIRKTLWSQSNKKWSDTSMFEYPIRRKNDSQDLPRGVFLKTLDFWRNFNDISIEGI